LTHIFLLIPLVACSPNVTLIHCNLNPLLISLYSIFLLAILAHCTDCIIYITLHYPLTHKHKYSIFALSTQAHEHYLSALFALLSLWTSTLTQSMHTVISV